MLSSDVSELSSSVAFVSVTPGSVLLSSDATELSSSSLPGADVVGALAGACSTGVVSSSVLVSSESESEPSSSPPFMRELMDIEPSEVASLAGVLKRAAAESSISALFVDAFSGVGDAPNNAAAELSMLTDARADARFALFGLGEPAEKPNRAAAELSREALALVDLRGLGETAPPPIPNNLAAELSMEVLCLVDLRGLGDPAAKPKSAAAELFILALEDRRFPFLGLGEAMVSPPIPKKSAAAELFIDTKDSRFSTISSMESSSFSLRTLALLMRSWTFSF
mmetsp:Transcript_1682/g.3596  ORF Transcript_1682/g.3596 Transcript_1682/m.3596 type:complete len:282 (-) Transcript_1682:1785-2630(-)